MAARNIFGEEQKTDVFICRKKRTNAADLLRDNNTFRHQIIDDRKPNVTGLDLTE